MNFIIFITILLFASACSHLYYFPTAHNVPMLRERNDACLNAGASYNPLGISSAEIQCAWAGTQHLAMSGTYISVTGESTDRTNDGRGYYADAAVGYFAPLNEELVFEVFGGFGQSRQKHQYGTSRRLGPSGDRQIVDFGTSGLSFRKYYIQPAIGTSMDAVDLVFSLRCSYLNFYSINNNLLADTINKYTYNSPLFFPLDEIAGQRYYYLVES